MNKVIARVFARRTKATPIDNLAFYDMPGLFPPNVDEVNINVVFTWDIKRAEMLAGQWSSIAPVNVGGPGIGMRGENFTPGMYVKPGYVITSRGCPNRCWFCSVWKRDGDIRELPITEGYNILDDNLLACSEVHIRAVFRMLKQQPQRAEFTGGLDAALLKDWHIDLLVDLKPKQIFFAYDTADDYEPLRDIARRLDNAGLKQGHVLRCYVLVGFPNDTFEKAESRLQSIVNLRYMPMAMLYRNNNGIYDRKWRQFQREWVNPYIVGYKLKCAPASNSSKV